MSLIRSSLLVGLGSAASRVLGFVRDILFAQALGAGPVADAFLAAFRLPNLVRRIVGEGGLNPVLVPHLSQLEPHDASRLAGDVMSGFALALLGLTAIVEIAAGALALLLAPGLHDDGQTLALVALYTRLSFPIVLCVTLASIAAAILNMRGRFAATALAPLAVNGGLILALVVLETASPFRSQRRPHGLREHRALPGFIQLVLVFLAVRGSDAIRFRIPRWSSTLKSLLLAGFPALVASGAVQLFVLAGTQVASFWPSAISWLYYAERVVQLPLGLIAALGASVLLPELARRHRGGETAAIVEAQHRALEVALLLALPASAALAILAFPITVVLFERGAFLSSDAEGTAWVLGALSLGLPFATLGKVLSQTLFARGALRQTLAAALLGIVVTLAGSFGLASRWGATGIALGISLGCVTHAAAMIWPLAQFGSVAAGSPLRRPPASHPGLDSHHEFRPCRRAACSSTRRAQSLWWRSASAALRFMPLAAWLTGALTRDDWASFA